MLFFFKFVTEGLKCTGNSIFIPNYLKLGKKETEKKRFKIVYFSKKFKKNWGYYGFF